MHEKAVVILPAVRRLVNTTWPGRKENACGAAAPILRDGSGHDVIGKQNTQRKWIGQSAN